MRLAKRRALLCDARLIEHHLDIEYLLLRRLQHGVHAPDNAHRQDYIGVLAAFEEIAQNIVGDAPDEGDDLVVRCLIHKSAEPLVFCLRVRRHYAVKHFRFRVAIESRLWLAHLFDLCGTTDQTFAMEVEPTLQRELKHR